MLSVHTGSYVPLLDVGEPSTSSGPPVTTVATTPPNASATLSGPPVTTDATTPRNASAAATPRPPTAAGNTKHSCTVYWGVVSDWPECMCVFLSVVPGRLQSDSLLIYNFRAYIISRPTRQALYALGHVYYDSLSEA